MWHSKPLIRLAQVQDAQRIALLCRQLGYETTVADVQNRLCNPETNTTQAIYVVDLPNLPVVGWIQVSVVTPLVLGQQAEIHGLIVAAEYRRYGIGRLLIHWGEQWAKQQGCDKIAVRSNLLREQAHQFYEQVGYVLLKKQAVFHKALTDDLNHRPDAITQSITGSEILVDGEHTPSV